MEAKNIIAFDYEKEGRIYRLQMPMGAPLNEAYAASIYFMEGMVKMINELAEKSVPKNLDEAVPEEVELIAEDTLTEV